MNRAPVSRVSRQQNTVDASSFGAELIALRIAVEIVNSLRYMLRMFCVSMEGSTNLFCDNQSVVRTATHPEKIRNESICNKVVRELRWYE